VISAAADVICMKQILLEAMYPQKLAQESERIHTIFDNMAII
jgi:hypothetical protein